MYYNDTMYYFIICVYILCVCVCVYFNNQNLLLKEKKKNVFLNSLYLTKYIFLTKEKNLRQIHKKYVAFIKNNFLRRK